MRTKDDTDLQRSLLLLVWLLRRLLRGLVLQQAAHDRVLEGHGQRRQPRLLLLVQQQKALVSSQDTTENSTPTIWLAEGSDRHVGSVHTDRLR